MKKALFALALLMVLGLLVAGCSKTIVDESSPEGEDQIVTNENNPENYIDEEIIDENSSIELGELI